MNWIKRLFSKKEETEQYDIHVVSSMFVCGDLIRHNFSISKIGRCIPCDRIKEKEN